MESVSGVPDRAYALSLPSSRRIREFMEYLNGCSGISPRTIALFLRTASLSPPDRLAFNLSVVSEILKINEVDNILAAGVTQVERMALIEAQRMPAGFCEVAHGLLNIHERWTFKRAMGKSFRDARMAKDRFWAGAKPLDSILGD